MKEQQPKIIKKEKTISHVILTKNNRFYFGCGRIHRQETPVDVSTISDIRRITILGGSVEYSLDDAL